MGVLTSIEGSNPSFSARRGGRAVECGGLENRFGRFRPTRVQIPPPPLGQAENPLQAAGFWCFGLRLRDPPLRPLGTARTRAVRRRARADERRRSAVAEAATVVRADRSKI